MICIMCNAETEIETHDCPAKPRCRRKPWQLEQPVNGYAAIYDRADRFLVALAMASAPVSDTEREANARLIASAPTLYAKLEELAQSNIANKAESRAIVKLLAQARGEE